MVIRYAHTRMQESVVLSGAPHDYVSIILFCFELLNKAYNFDCNDAMHMKL